MDETLVPYKPGHPEAPKFKRRTKGVAINKHTEKAEPKIKYSTYPHKRFRAAHKECKLKDSELTAILRAFNENMVEAALTNRGGTLLPNRMGKLQVMMYPKGNKRRIDRATSEKLGYEVGFSILRNAGKFPYATIEVYGDSYNMPNKYLWEFKASAPFRRAQQEVLVVDRTRFVGARKEYIAYYRKEKFYKKEFAKKNDEELLLTYNEFEGIV